MHEIDYTEIFTLTIRHKLLKIFLTIAILLEMIILQIDIIGAYFESFFGEHNHLIYMKILQRCKVSQERLVYKIFKSLYELKQVGRLWNKILIKFFQKISFVPINGDSCILIYHYDDVFIILGVYVDDLALIL